MKLGFEITTDMNALSKEIEKEIEKEALNLLIEAIETSVERVRKKQLNQPYQDHTGNLLSSTGFIIYKDGKVVHKNFKESPIGTDKLTGLEEGLKAALSELRESTGWGVVMVAGMDYASHVESKEYTVILDATTDIDDFITESFRKFGIIE